MANDMTTDPTADALQRELDSPREVIPERDTQLLTMIARILIAIYRRMPK